MEGSEIKSPDLGGSWARHARETGIGDLYLEGRSRARHHTTDTDVAVAVAAGANLGGINCQIETKIK